MCALSVGMAEALAAENAASCRQLDRQPKLLKTLLMCTEVEMSMDQIRKSLRLGFASNE